MVTLKLLEDDSEKIAVQNRFRFEVGPPFLTSHQVSMPLHTLLEGRRIANKLYCDKSPVHKKGTDVAKKKKIVRRVWTSSDVRELKSLAKKKTGVAKISKALKRTIGATAVKAHQLGVSLDTRG